MDNCIAEKTHKVLYYLGIFGQIISFQCTKYNQREARFVRNQDFIDSVIMIKCHSLF